MKRYSFYSIIWALFSFSTCFTAQAATVELGWATAPLMPFGPSEFSVANALAIPLDGSIILAGTHSPVDPSGIIPSEFAALQLIPNVPGSVDLGWATAISEPFGISEADSVSSIAIDPDGNFILAGFHTRTGSRDQFAALQLIPSGPSGVILGWATSPPEPFGPSSTDFASDVAIDSNGNSILAGRHDPFPGLISQFAALQLIPTGSTVSLGWATALIAPFGPIDSIGDDANGVVIDANDAIILAGEHNPSGPQGRRFAALQLIPNASGSVDLGWAIAPAGPFGSPSDDSASSIAIDGEGNFVLAGTHMPSGGTSRFAALQLIPDGTGVMLGWSISPVEPFGPSIIDAALDVAIDVAGNVILVGLHIPSGVFQPKFAALQLVPNGLGGVDLGWATAVDMPFGSSLFDQANGVAIDADNNPILAGFHNPSFPEGPRFAALQLIQLPPPPSLSPLFNLPFVALAAT